MIVWCQTFYMLLSFNPYLLSYCPFGKTNTKYNLTWHLTWMIPNDLYIWKLNCFCIFLNKLSRFFGNPTFSNIFPHARYVLMTFELCTFVYLFVVYFLFAPVISASIHHYVNYFDIQVLMMVTETLTSTLCHNKFTYLDYVFLLPSNGRILIHIYFHVIK